MKNSLYATCTHFVNPFTKTIYFNKKIKQNLHNFSSNEFAEYNQIKNMYPNFNVIFTDMKAIHLS